MSLVSDVYVGTDLAGTAALGNQFDGIAIHGNDNVVSSVKVVHNAGDGIVVIVKNAELLGGTVI